MRIDVVIPARNAVKTLPDCLSALESQNLPDDAVLCVYVVDDASRDATAQVAKQPRKLDVRLVTNAVRRGRSGACNAGAAAGTGEFVVILDSDCRLLSNDALTAHWRAVEATNGISSAPVRVVGDTFWARYSKSVARSRNTPNNPADAWLLTTACAACLRTTLETLGGFDDSFSTHGFEDRDLLARAIDAGFTVVQTDAAAAAHESGDTVGEIAGKMRIAARDSAPVFAEKHPDRYRRMRYAAVDVDCLKSPVAAILRYLSYLDKPAARLADWQIARRWLPYSQKSRGVLIASALAYARGSSQRLPAQRARRQAAR